MANFLTNIDLKGNQLLNAVIQNLAVAPASPKLGQLYYDTTTKALKVYDGENWVAAGQNTNLAEDIKRLVQTEDMASYFANSSATSNKINDEVEGWASNRLEERATPIIESVIGQKQSSILDEASLRAQTIAESEASKAVARLVESAPEELNTFKEIADAIQQNKDALSQIANTARVHTQELNFATGTTQQISHNLGRRFVQVSLYDQQGSLVLADVRLVSDNAVEVQVAGTFTELLMAVVVG